MARSRNIKPGFFLNDELAEIEPLGRLLFAGLWTVADREGRLEDRPKKIKAAILPYDNCDIELMLQELADKHFIIRYESSGEQYIAIPNWKKHQNPHVKESASTIPAPDSHSASTVQQPEQHGRSPADSLNLIPDSLNRIPLDLNPEQTGSSSSRDDPRLVEIYRTYQQEGYGIPSSLIIQEIEELYKEYGYEWLFEAIKEGVMQNKRKISYVKGILENWKTEGGMRKKGPPKSKQSEPKSWQALRELQQELGGAGNDR